MVGYELLAETQRDRHARGRRRARLRSSRPRCRPARRPAGGPISPASAPDRPPPPSAGRRYHGVSQRRRHDATLGRAVQRGERSAGRRLHALDRDRSRAGRRRPGRLDRPRPRPRARRPAHRPTRSTRSSRASRALGEEVDAGRSTGTRRSRTSTSTSRRRSAERIGPVAGQAPHRPLAQRPGRDRPAPLAPPRDRPARRRARRRSSGRSSSSPSATATAVLPGHDPHPARPAGPVRPSPAGLRRDARARPRPARRRAAAGRTSARSGRVRWPVPAIPLDREATARELGFDGVTAQLARRRQRPRLRGRGRWRRPRSAMVHLVAPRRGGHLVVEPALRVRPASPMPSRPAAR